MASPGRDLGNFLEALEKMDLADIAGQAIDKTAEEITRLNVDQLKHGETSTGERLKKYRNNKYARIKNEMNPLPGLGNPDFILFGGFTSKIETERRGDTIGVHSYDEKAPYLEERDGADRIYGLGEERHNIYVTETLEPAFQAEVIEALNG